MDPAIISWPPRLAVHVGTRARRFPHPTPFGAAHLERDARVQRAVGIAARMPRGLAKGGQRSLQAQRHMSGARFYGDQAYQRAGATPGSG
eukprot:116754-Chlamydomonas_euryale.AAC.1